MPHSAIDSTAREFLDGLASNTPTPGGGSAAALAGALGAGLVVQTEGGGVFALEL